MAKVRKPKTLLIDADVLRYKLAYINTAAYDFDGDGEGVVEAVSPSRAKAMLADEIDSLCEKFKTNDFVLPLSVNTNFRKKLYPAYKVNRTQRPKPALWYELDKYIKTLWPERIITRNRLEGDDILGILATAPDSKWVKGTPIIVSIDKDMKTIPGMLYNPTRVDGGVHPITEDDANYFWMFQTLTGDTTDCYPGCPGIGPKKAEAALLPWTKLPDLWNAVVDVYESKGLTEKDALLQARLARILRHGDYSFKNGKVRLWKPDKKWRKKN